MYSILYQVKYKYPYRLIPTRAIFWQQHWTSPLANLTDREEFLKGCNSTEDPDKDTNLFSFIWFKLYPGYYRALYIDLNCQLFWTERCKKNLNLSPDKNNRKILIKHLVMD